MARYAVAPLRVRELKQELELLQSQIISRTFTGAWIETFQWTAFIFNRRRTFTGAWIETRQRRLIEHFFYVAPLRVRELKPIYQGA